MSDFARVWIEYFISASVGETRKMLTRVEMILVVGISNDLAGCVC